MKKTCIGITAVVLVIGLVGITAAALLAPFAFQFLVRMLDDVTGSADAQPTGLAFFEATGGWDYRRIALIEPYQDVSLDKETWAIGLKTNSIRYQPSIRITKLDVVNNRFIITYAPDASLGGERVNELWFVIIPEEKLEKGFTKHEEFLTYLRDKGINNSNLSDVNELYSELVNKGYLEWFPEEYK